MEFLLDPDVVFLNHGSFGACPREVHDEYQRIQRRLEMEPVQFIQRDLPGLLAEARSSLADFIGAGEDDVVFVVNPTYAVNEIVRSLRLGPGDEVVTSNHEYGACRNSWQFMSERNGFSVVEAALSTSLTTAEAFTEGVWSAVTANTKVIFLSHITSPTALTFPIEDICARARSEGIITVIDGAHVPGQMALDVAGLGADYYVGTCHKWMCAPKGSAFFYARADMQALIEPLVVGWGWGDERQFDSGRNFIDYHEWLGTDDPSAFLTVPAAIAYQQDHDWPAIQSECHNLAISVLDRAVELPGVERVHGNDWFSQMALLEIAREDSTPAIPAKELQRRLFDGFRVEVPVISWPDSAGRSRTFVRVSLQAYNTHADVDAFVAALSEILDVSRRSPRRSPRLRSRHAGT